jgi:hypothetical protein
MDIEVSRFGDPAAKNAQYVIQPNYVPTNVERFTIPSGPLTYSFRWEPGRVSFRTVRALNGRSSAPAVADHVFTSGIPTHGIESVRMNLYDFHNAKIPIKSGAEVVIEKFEYLP